MTENKNTIYQNYGMQLMQGSERKLWSQLPIIKRKV